jgi:hypothetical protein
MGSHLSSLHVIARLGGTIVLAAVTLAGVALMAGAPVPMP